MRLERIINVPALLDELSPSGALTELAGNADLDKLQDEFDSIESGVARHLAEPSLVSRLEDDFALCVPAIADAAEPFEAWAIPLLSALVGPGAPVLSFGLTVACKVAIFALKKWAAKRSAGLSRG